MKTGVCYYPEHWPEAQWASDAAHMRRLGLSVVRIGEFAWSRLESANAELHFDWLERAIDTLHAAGLQVVLGTPTRMVGRVNLAQGDITVFHHFPIERNVRE